MASVVVLDAWWIGLVWFLLLPAIATPSSTPPPPIFTAPGSISEDGPITINCSSCGVSKPVVDDFGSLGAWPVGGSSVKNRLHNDGGLESDAAAVETGVFSAAAIDEGVVLETAKALHAHLRALVNDELGLTELQATFDKLELDNEAPDSNVNIDELRASFEEKIKRYTRLVEENCVAAKLTPTSQLTDRRASEKFVECCELPSKILRSSRSFRTEVSFEFPCQVSPPDSPEQAGELSSFSNLTSVMIEHQMEDPTLKWQFVVTDSDVLLQYPATKAQIYQSSAEKKRVSAAREECRVGYNALRHRSTYFSAKYPKPKLFILMIDVGSSASGSSLQSSIEAARSLLALTPDNALVNVVSVGEKVGVAVRKGILWDQQVIKRDVESCRGDGPSGLLPISPKILSSLDSFLDSLAVSRGSTNHSAGFKMAVDLAKPHLQRLDSLNDEKILHIFYLTAGKLAEHHRQSVLESLASLRPRGPVKISVVVPPSEEQSMDAPARAFLNKITTFMYQSEDLLGNAVDDEVDLKTLKESSIYYLGKRSTSFRTMLETAFSKTEARSVAMRFSRPVWDAVGQGPVVTASKYCARHSVVVGVDIPLAKLVDFVSYHSSARKNDYAFVIDDAGHVIMHPKFPRPVAMKEQPPVAHISELEEAEGFASILERILADVSGEINTTVASVDVSYSWRRVSNSPYVICTVREKDRCGKFVSKGYEDSGKKDSVKFGKKSLRLVGMAPEDKTKGVADLLYHRLDAVSSVKGLKFCKHFHRLATLDRSAVYFSPAAFLDPLSVLVRSREENEKATAARAQTYVAYMKDASDLIGNPGFRPGVKQDAQALGIISSYWTHQFRHQQSFALDPVGPLQRFVVRRYVSTARGVLVTFPATTVENEALDPTKERWFRRSVSAPGRIVFTGPVLDAGGAGYLVTVSHSVFEGKTASLHSSTDSVVAVMGMDLSMGYLHRVLTEWLPYCDEEDNPGITCFLMDDEGYVVSHPVLFHPRSPQASTRLASQQQASSSSSGAHSDRVESREQLHVTHLEPVLANDLLHRGDVVVKKSCDRIADSTTQRYYKFNSTVGYAVESRIRGEMCGSYLLTAVPGTNLLLGVLNLTACPDLSTALFCPCSTEDRSCFHCNRMEQKECECPCECPLGMGRCYSSRESDEEGLNNTGSSGDGNRHFKRDICPAPVEQPVPTKSSGFWMRPGLLPPWDRIPACLSVDCRSLETRKQCLGISGCSWCKYEPDGVTRLREPFCGDQRKCYWGVLDATSPYGEVMRESSPLGDSAGPTRSSPLGPVAGGIMTCFLFLALGVYCYWHHGAKDGLSLANARHMGLSQAAEDDDNGNGKRGRRRFGSSWECKMDKYPDYDEDGEGENGDDLLEIPSGRDLSAIEKGAINGPSKQRRRRYLPGAVGDSDDHGYSTMTPLEDNASEHNNQGPYFPNGGPGSSGVRRNDRSQQQQQQQQQVTRKTRERASGRFGSPSRRTSTGEYHQQVAAAASLLNPYNASVRGDTALARQSTRPSSPLLATEQSVVSAADSAHGTDCNGAGYSASSTVEDDDSSPDELATGLTTSLRESSGSGPNRGRNNESSKSKPPWEMAGFQGNRVVASVQVHFVDT